MAKPKITFKPSENFSLQELIHSTTADKHRISNIPDVEQIRNLQYGVDMVLQPLRNKYGKPVVITSGYRSAALNKLVGGVANSYHLQGNAADIRVRSQEEADELFQILKTIPSVDVALFEHSTSSCWLHVQWNMNKTPRHHFNFNYIAR